MIYFQLTMGLNTRELIFTFRCKFYDTFHRYKFQSSKGAYEDKTATLSEQDTVWTEVRHLHMREAIDKLMADFNKFLQENAAFKGCCPFYM